MANSSYIVSNDLLTSNPPKCEWHATAIPADPTQSLLVVRWTDVNAELDFESLPGVSPLGDPWEPLPDSAAPLLASFAPPAAKGAPLAPLPATPDTVSKALRKVSWPGARMLR